MSNKLSIFGECIADVEIFYSLKNTIMAKQVYIAM